MWRELSSVALLAVLLSALNSIDLNAQQEGINRIALGPLDITLGDDQSRTLEKLRSRYTLSEQKAALSDFRAESSWKFSSANDSGNVDFSFGRVSYVYRAWFPPQTAVNASYALIDTLYRLVQDGRRHCEVFSPVPSIKTIALRCGHNIVSVWADDSKVNLTETLLDDEPRPAKP